MRDLLAVWKNTRSIVQVAVTAALYAAMLIPFKAVAVVIPGVTEVRPANAIPIVFSLLFGPAAAWGAAFGNLIGDSFGTLGPGSAFGFVANFLYGYVPYRIWGIHRLAPKETAASPVSGRGIGEYILVVGLAALICAVVVSWGADLIGLAPFKVLVLVISLNNFLMAAVLGPPLLLALYPRVRRWGLLWWQVAEQQPVRRGVIRGIGTLLCWVGCIAAVVAGMSVAADSATEMEVARAVTVPLALVVVGILMI
jgi:energy-coupling factor transport system substrate-specific component